MTADYDDDNDEPADEFEPAHKEEHYRSSNARNNGVTKIQASLSPKKSPKKEVLPAPKAGRKSAVAAVGTIQPEMTSSPTSNRPERKRKSTFDNSDFVFNTPGSRKRKQVPEVEEPRQRLIVPDVAKTVTESKNVKESNPSPSPTAVKEEKPSQGGLATNDDVTPKRSRGRPRRDVTSTPTTSATTSTITATTSSIAEAAPEKLQLFTDHQDETAVEVNASANMDEGLPATPQSAVPEKKKRGRKKKDPNAPKPEVSSGNETPGPRVDTPSASSNGKRARKTVNYREMNNEDAIADDEDKVEKSPDLSTTPNDTPPVKGKRGRKRKQPTDDNDSLIVNRLVCGSCKDTFKIKSAFQYHAAAAHGGVARLANEPQEFTEEEKVEAAREAFNRVKKVTCFRCKEKSFTTFLGLKYHLSLCNKSEAEIEEMKIECEHCGFRCLPSTMRTHMFRHTKVEAAPKPDQSAGDSDDEANLTLTSSGRKQRRAANKASLKVADAIKMMKTTEDGETAQDDNLDDDEYSGDEEFAEKLSPQISQLYQTKKHPTIAGASIVQCKQCDHTTDTVKEMMKHAISAHAEELIDEEESESDEGEDEDQEESADDESEEEEEDVVKTGGGDIRSRSHGKNRKPLSNDTEMIAWEKKFREENFDKNCFENFQTFSSDWKLLDRNLAKTYLPVVQTSVNFESSLCIQKGNASTKVQQLKMFESCVNNPAAVTFFAGGPILASAWCPRPPGSSTPFLVAVSVERTFDDEFKIRPENQKTQIKSLLQFWSCHKAQTVFADPPKFLFGIAHDYGRIRSLEWCPSGCYDQGQKADGGGKPLPRVGLLAAGCEDGTVRIFVVPHPEQVTSSSPSSPIYKCDKAVITLKRPDDSVSCSDDQRVICVKVAWFRGKRHRVIAASFTDGQVALWDLETTSSFLRTTDDVTGRLISLLPYRMFPAHLRNNLTSLAISSEAEADGFPLHIATGSVDRMFYSWDLGNCDGGHGLPLRESRQNFITDVIWQHHYPSHVTVAHDDSNLQSNTRSTMMDMRVQDHMRNFSIVSQNSAMASQAYSPIKNVLVSSTTAGEVVLFIMPSASRNFNSVKDLNQHRVNVYRAHLGQKFSLDNKSNNNFKYLETYSELLGEKPLLHLVDAPTHDFSLTVPEELNAARGPNTMMPENPELYPLTSINTVAVTADLDSATLLFSGGQSGLGRIHHLATLDIK